MNKYLSQKIKVLSFFSIILVVFVHSKTTSLNLTSGKSMIANGYNSIIQDFIIEGIARVAVPFFFLISGYLFFLNNDGSLKEYIEKLKKRIISICIPFLFWSLWGILFYFLLQIPFQTRIFFTDNLVQDYTMIQFFRKLIIDPLPFQLWFLKDLFLLVIISPVIFYGIKYLKSGIVIMLFIPWVSNYYFRFIGSESLFFFNLGGYIVYHHKIISFNLGKYLWPLCFIWLVFISVNTSFLFFQAPAYLGVIILHKLSILVGILVCWNMYDKFFALTEFKPKAISIITSSFFIFAFHEPFLTMTKKGLMYTLGASSELNSLIVFFIAPAITIAVSIYLGLSIKSISPKFYGIITGGR